MELLDIVKVFGGGLAGAIATALYNAYHRRVQSLRYEVSVFQTDIDPRGPLRLSVEDPRGGTHCLRYFFSVKIIITNSSNLDFKTFEFGLTLPPGLTAIESDVIIPDRAHPATKVRDSALDKADHVMTMDESLDAFTVALLEMEKPRHHEIDYLVKSFNRGDAYTILLAVVPLVVHEQHFERETRATITGEDIELTTPTKGVRLVRKSKRRSWPRLGLSRREEH